MNMLKTIELTTNELSKKYDFPKDLFLKRIQLKASGPYSYMFSDPTAFLSTIPVSDGWDNHEIDVTGEISIQFSVSSATNIDIYRVL